MNPRVDPATLLAVDPVADHVFGLASAPVTMIEYADFECPTCRLASVKLKTLLPHFGDRLRFVFRHFPLREVHPHAEFAAEAAEAAAAQNRFWPLHDLLFAHQQQLDDHHVRQYALQAGLDMARFADEMRDHVYRPRVQAQLDSGRQLRVRSTPTFYVNGEQADISFGLDYLQQDVERALKAAIKAAGG